MIYSAVYPDNCDWFRERYNGIPETFCIYELVAKARQEIEDLEQLIKSQKEEKKNVRRKTKRRSSSKTK